VQQVAAIEVPHVTQHQRSTALSPHHHKTDRSNFVKLHRHAQNVNKATSKASPPQLLLATATVVLIKHMRNDTICHAQM
jgi:predicted NAD-dependent protein-ADP-ribosyltransferase YbiA (DUF1768 family)